MPRYFFDTRDDERLMSDDIGLELPDVPAAARAAARSLAELALDVIPDCSERCLGVEVRDENDDQILTTELTFRAALLKQQAA